MTSAMPGWDVRSSDSVHPVHSWKCSQTTEGLSPFAAASTIWETVVADMPTAAPANVQIRTKSRRETIGALSLHVLLSNARTRRNTAEHSRNAVA